MNLGDTGPKRLYNCRTSQGLYPANAHWESLMGTHSTSPIVIPRGFCRISMITNTLEDVRSSQRSLQAIKLVISVTLFNLFPKSARLETVFKITRQNQKANYGQNLDWKPELWANYFFYCIHSVKTRGIMCWIVPPPSPPLHKSYVTSNSQYFRTWPYLDRAFREVTK